MSYVFHAITAETNRTLEIKAIMGLFCTISILASHLLYWDRIYRICFWLQQDLIMKFMWWSHTPAYWTQSWFFGNIKLHSLANESCAVFSNDVGQAFSILYYAYKMCNEKQHDFCRSFCKTQHFQID